jgi:nickel/cobalt transporter (NiCoT) family protein
MMPRVSGTRRRVAGLAAAILALHAIGFGALLVFVVPQRFDLGDAGVFGIGLGLTAYTLGLRHAFDADHIAAIDNTTRKLMADGQRPLSVGFFFSLGHSTIVLVLTLLLAVGARALGAEVESDGSTLHQVTGLLGTGVSAAFLYLIAAINVAIFAGIARVFRRMRRGQYDEGELEQQLRSRGVMNRVVGRFTGTITAPWQMYPVGVLFGLGFDTATEVALLFLAAGAASTALPVYVVLCLPVLFAAGMSLLDTIDGAMMSFAYGWAFSRPLRRIYYNLTVTGLSIAVALIIGSIELASILAERLGLRGGFWERAASVDLNLVGFAIVGLFVLTWGVALAVWHFGRIEDRWATSTPSR